MSEAQDVGVQTMTDLAASFDADLPIGDFHPKELEEIEHNEETIKENLDLVALINDAEAEIQILKDEV